MKAQSRATHYRLLCLSTLGGAALLSGIHAQLGFEPLRISLVLAKTYAMIILYEAAMLVPITAYALAYILRTTIITISRESLARVLCIVWLVAAAYALNATGRTISAWVNSQGNIYWKTLTSVGLVELAGTLVVARTAVVLSIVACFIRGVTPLSSDAQCTTQ
jgi:hypothetical protein